MAYALAGIEQSGGPLFREKAIWSAILYTQSIIYIKNSNIDERNYPLVKVNNLLYYKAKHVTKSGSGRCVIGNCPFKKQIFLLFFHGRNRTFEL